VSVASANQPIVRIREHTSAYVSIRQHTSNTSPVSIASANQPIAYVGIRRHTSAYVSIPEESAHIDATRETASETTWSTLMLLPPRFCIRQHTSAYVSIHQYTSAYASIRARRLGPHSCCLPHIYLQVSKRQHTSAYTSQIPAGGRPLCQHTSAYASIREHARAIPAGGERRRADATPAHTRRQAQELCPPPPSCVSVCTFVPVKQVTRVHTSARLRQPSQRAWAASARSTGARRNRACNRTCNRACNRAC
jgi:hypothetical protein